ncbi:GNAT family N-acetyltransferase [Aquirufa ecclesiirivi]|uniref:GNAT family N-acetyltransferase n=1 Tax=Aquirufa ecclesiirivi TaxID=2715124 RepID=A0ABT4JJ51_9BACT|nr:GNAT family N-acetyltransferase [Aquirufa ecclesiirivi]MCZ2476285.1 GNAT family N-acetyltransferase [Aquirufa ecclesiirivi]NHC49317.1 GNAT family N-acetyltransferase [Aquirufa ecclesiirivi]
MEIRSPQNSEEWEAYFQLRFKVLREPWNQALGTEHLSDDPTAIHVFAIENNQVLGVARMHESSPQQGQVRCVAVASSHQGRGIGKLLMNFLEQKATENNWKEIILEARENAVPFYSNLGYIIEKESYLLFGEIQHYTMKKVI